MNQHLQSDEQSHISERLWKIPKIYSGRSTTKNILEETQRSTGSLCNRGYSFPEVDSS